MQHLAIFAGLASLAVASACSPSAPQPARVTAPAASPSAATSAAGTTPAPSKAGPAGAMCGGIAGFGCATGLYCAFPLEAHCGAADQSGICQVIPDVCTEEYAPVCGCNDKTYPNPCHAAREGVSFASRGECAKAAPPLAEGELCGTRGVHGECGPAFYCKYKSDCGATDSGGVCTRRPQICTRIYRPVCGCDDKTYASDCVAASAGTAVRHEGECKK